MHTSRKTAVALITLMFGVVAIVYVSRPSFIEWFAGRFPSSSIVLGKVTATTEELRPINGTNTFVTHLKIHIVSGSDKNHEVTLSAQGTAMANGKTKIQPGELVILGKSQEYANEPYVLLDRYRLTSLFILALTLAMIAILVGNTRGITALVGLGISIVVLMGFVVPQILNGKSPLGISFLGALMIAVCSLYATHGLNLRTSIALFSTAVILGLTMLIAILSIRLTHLIGIPSEEAFYLQLAHGSLDMRGILLAGILIGTLGVLEDITIGQTVMMYEFSRANPALPMKTLYAHGMAVGKEHIASLINTLFLAYVGASFPFLLYLMTSNATIPLWLVINGEGIAIEIVRTVIGSIALILAVPLATFLAALFFHTRIHKQILVG